MDVIDLANYAESRDRSRVFAVYGEEGERSRFALPVWRAVYLLDGERGGIVWTGPDAEDPPVPRFVLDLVSEPARTGFDGRVTREVLHEKAPSVAIVDDTVAVLLARDGEREWFLVVTGEEVGRHPSSPRDRKDLLFVAGECAGLLRTPGRVPDLP